MKMYVLSADTNHYATFVPVDEDYDEVFGDLWCKGEELSANWPKPLEIELDEEDENKPVGDFGFLFSGSLVLSNRAKELLSGMLSAQDELMQLSLAGEDYWLLNIRNILNALNAEATEFNEVGLLVKRVFDSRLVSSSDFFKIEEDNKTYIYCSERAVDVMKASGLTGLVFEEVDVV
ncbi:hypothetical protein GZ78_19945 [Endozoicomonas numazuensis]|uniref:Immunity MXAN-0049 protein domain-containing protein n=2 Tax=Endozoicomonas numazuensis TaxID=1137799 RepID=A0A081NEP4_9GAMM|nr:hypothetical protein GZ78_19945 [Endozoicomonas numazuensis]